MNLPLEEPGSFHMCTSECEGSCEACDELLCVDDSHFEKGLGHFHEECWEVFPKEEF